jgi:hypothetical protein
MSKHLQQTIVKVGLRWSETMSHEMKGHLELLLSHHQEIPHSIENHPKNSRLMEIEIENTFIGYTN